MSEYQYIAFRAVDRALTDKELAFAETQSSRAEISRWTFENEYHYGDFRGDVHKLLRHGYGVHLHYANYGVRTVAFRLPHGLPIPEKVWSQYVGEEGFTWSQDAKGKGGILSLSPFRDAGSIDEIWEPHSYMDDLVELRNRLVQGDLRTLYLIWLCTSGGDYADPAEIEPPVPLGLDRLFDSCGDVLGFFGLDPLMLVAASEGTPAMNESPETDPNQTVNHWIDSLSNADTREVLRRLMTENEIGVKAELLAKCRNMSSVATWPTVKTTRTFQSLFERAEQLRDEETQRKQQKQAAKAKQLLQQAERKRQERMKQMVKDPEKWLREADQLADARGTANYKAAADVLADLREAIGGAEGEKITRKHAAHLSKKHPTLNHLKSSLQKRNLLD